MAFDFLMPEAMMPEAMMPKAMMPEAMMPEAMLPGMPQNCYGMHMLTNVLCNALH